MNSTIESLVQSLQSSTAQVQQTFGSLSDSQLNWKPSPEKWGVGECLEHLVKSNLLYFQQFEKIAKGEHKNSTWQSISPFSGFFGSMLVKAVNPDNVKKVKTANVFKPAKSAVHPNIVSDFAKMNEELAGYFKRFEGTDLKKTKITSPVSGFITYSLEDAINLLTIHEQRHINQAKGVMEIEGFPKS
jgi:hypothetical protein